MTIQQKIFPILRVFSVLSILIVTAVACDPNPPLPEPPNSPTEEDTPPPPTENGQTPGGPVNYPAIWQEALLANTDLQGLIDSTTAFINEGKGESSYMAEAYLYRGLAQLQLERQAEAQSDLETALQHEDQLTSLDTTQEKVLLYRGLAVVNAKMGNSDLAILYRDKAGGFDPNVTLLIQSEIDNKALEKSKLYIEPVK